MTAKIINRLIIILITAALMLLTLLDWKLSPVRVLFAIALVTILPGYALTTAIFINTPLGILEKFAFSCGFSLGIVSLGGILLNFTHWGIQSVSWVILLGGISLIASVVAIVRMQRAKEIDLSVTQIPLRLRQVVLMALAVVIFGGVYVFARHGAASQSLPSTTRIWILWTDDSHTEAVLGIQNQENVPMQYQLQLSTLQGQVQEWTPIALAPGATWEVHYMVPNNVAESDFFKATLYKLDDPGTVYREVYLKRIIH
ncbi:MAG: DUF1616 domain-containing protein [Anaerolineales bacterium]